MKRILFIAIFAAILVTALVSVILLSSGRSEAAVDLSPCNPDKLAVEKVVDCWAKQASAALRQDGADPLVILPQLESQLTKEDFQIAQFCHNAMHTTGRQFAEENNVTLATLQNYIPKSDSSNCPAGFVHGMISVMGIDSNNAPELIRLCSKEDSRARRIACAHGIGHAFRRSFIEDDDMKKTIAACKAMGEKVASDCAQGAYHDYLFAFAGIDDTKKPANLKKVSEVCQNKPSDFIAECWYRLFTFYPAAFEIKSAKDMRRFCAKTDAARACFSAGMSAFNNPPRLPDQCRPFRGQAAEDCFAGISLKVPEVLEPKSQRERRRKIEQRQQAIAFLMKRCLLMPDGRGERACAYWLSYDSVNGLSLAQTPAEEEAICSKVNDGFVGLCRRAVEAAQRRDIARVR